MSNLREVVPEEFARLGWSGLFAFRARLDGAWEGPSPPTIICGNSILLLRFEGDEAVLIRKDENAIVDICTGRLAHQGSAAPEER